MSGPIITVATLKGGSGKSTVASCLAAYWRQKRLAAGLIDADPQASLVRLAERDRQLGGTPVVRLSSREAEAYRAAAAPFRPAVIDTPGFRDAVTHACLAAADLVVVPVKPSPLDVDVVLDTVHDLFRHAGSGAPEFVCLLTQTTREAVIARHIRAELSDAGFPVLAAELANRVAYGEAALFGATPSLMQPQGAAARDIAQLARELEQRLDLKPAGRRKAS